MSQRSTARDNQAECRNDPQWNEAVWEGVVEQIEKDSNELLSYHTLLQAAYGASPIETETIDRAIEKREWGLEDKITRKEIGTALQIVQIDWVQRAESLLDAAYSLNVDGINIAGMDHSRIYIEDCQSEWQRSAIGVLIWPELQNVMRYIHKLQAMADGVVSERILDDDGHNIIVITKPDAWYAGQMNALRDLAYMIFTGLSPTEAIDYWVVNRIGMKQTDWAENWRSRSQGSISGNISKAKENLSEKRPDLMNPDTMESTSYDMDP